MPRGAPRDWLRSQLLLAVCSASMAVSVLGAPNAEAEEPFDTVTRYTEALQSGDTIAVKALIGGRLYQKKELLLDQNEEYPDFLRDFYEGAEFQVLGELIDVGPRGQGVAVEILFADGNSSEIIAIVERSPEGTWKVVDEVDAGP